MKIIYLLIIQVLVFTGCTRKNGLENSENLDIPGTIISENIEIINNSNIIQEENIDEITISENQINDVDLNNIWGIDFTIINLNENRFFSHDNNSYAIPITWNTENISGVYINLSGEDIFIPIPYLVGVTYILWSDDQNYLFIDNGTYVIRSFVCINIENESIIGYIKRFGEYYQIINKNIFITTTDDGYRIDGLLEKYSVFQYTVEENNVIEEIIFNSDEFTDYYVIDFDGENVVIRKEIFENTHNENPWGRYIKIDEEIIFYRN